MTTVYVHDLNPIAINLFGILPIRWYGLSYLTGFLFAYLIMTLMSKCKLSSLPVTLVGDFVFTVALGAVIGGRLGYCLFYSPSLFLEWSPSIPFWGVFAINNGGMASHGGMIGIILSCLYFARKHRLEALHLLDLTSFTAPVGVFFGRIANFVNGELVGRSAPTNLPWAVKFPEDIYQFGPSDLSQLGPAANAVGVNTNEWLSLLSNYSRGPQPQIMSILDRIIGAIRDGNTLVRDALEPVLTFRHPSQLYEALLEGLFLFVLISLFWRKPRKTGLVTALFLTSYGVVRIIGEQFRMPDPQIGFQVFGTTRGQNLSVLLIFGGLILYSVRKGSRGTGVGGWWKSSLRIRRPF